MSQSERLKKQVHHPPVHAFYVAQQQQPNGPEIIIEEDTNGNRKAILAATPTNSASMIKPTIKRIQTTAIDQNASSISSASSSSTPSFINSKMSPPLINAVDSSLFNDKTSTDRENANDLPWLAPLLGVLGTLGVIAIALLYLIGRNRKKKASVAVTMINDDEDADNTRGESTFTGGRLPNIYKSWASFSTFNTSAVDLAPEKKSTFHHDNLLSPSTPPPAYYHTTKQQKRLTADTLVDHEDNSSMIMLKSQYSPQLAFSPSLVAGEFQQQQEDRPPLPFINNCSTLSPSNTLIDNAGVLLQEEEDSKDSHYWCASISSAHDPNKKKKRIEMYEPQVNLLVQDPFISPDSYYTDDKEVEEKKAADSHHIVDMDNTTTLK